MKRNGARRRGGGAKPKTKRCLACGRRKPRTEFGGHVRASDGLQPTCRACCGDRLNRGRVRALQERQKNPTPPEVARAIGALVGELQAAGYERATIDVETGEVTLGRRTVEKVKVN